MQTTLPSNGSVKAYDLAVFIGRFQPFHKGHLEVVRHALTQADHVLILVGSSNLARDTRNPFTFEERTAMIWNALDGMAVGRITTGPLPDSPYDLQEWIENVQHQVKGATSALAPRVCLTGHERDHTSFYLRLFPQWDYVPVPNPTSIEATHLRADYFAGGVNFFAKEWRDSGPIWPDVVPPETINFLNAFRGSPAYGRLMEDRKAEIAYKEKYGDKEPHVTCDAVVIQSGHVLVVRRGGAYGRGLLAMPGGFLEGHETLLQGSVRECFEETQLLSHVYGRHTPGAPISLERQRALHTHMRGRDTFDEPTRSRRGRIITHAFLFKLPDDPLLPPVEGTDDAQEAFWLPISQVRPEDFFEDHAFIIAKMMRQYL